MPGKGRSHAVQPGLFDENILLKTAPCVPKLRQAVAAWRMDRSYAGVTETTRTLLNYWFYTDHPSHPVTQRPFTYHPAQQEAIETLIYVYEVAKTRRCEALLKTFALPEDVRPLIYDEFARYCIKMATGSGKTKVMALAIAWQYLNAVLEKAEEDYAKTFLVIAPNIIVLERLKSDFAAGHIFRVDPIIPEELKEFWDMAYSMRGDSERTPAEGHLFLTNIQQLQERSERAGDTEPAEMTAVLGRKPSAQPATGPGFAERIAERRGKLLILNDEAHHTHEEDSEWNKTIRALHRNMQLSAQLDFSATPRDANRNLFAWTISDYPLKQAIEDRIVKQPVRGVAHIQEAMSDQASVRYEGFLIAGVERWQGSGPLYSATHLKRDSGVLKSRGWAT
jgi:type III restriction enzyme